MTDNGTLILEKDNPSGLPEHDDSLEIPVVLKRASSGGGAPSTPPIASGKCVVSGCSGQICADSEVVSTCEYKAVYACYKNTKAVCERQTSGECGWTETPALKQCLVEAE